MTQNLYVSGSLLGGCRVQAVRSILQLQHVKPPCRELFSTPLPPTRYLQRGWSRNYCRWSAHFTTPCHRSVQASDSHLTSALMDTRYSHLRLIRCLSYALGRHSKVGSFTTVATLVAPLCAINAVNRCYCASHTITFHPEQYY